MRSHLKMRHSDRLKNIPGIRTAEILIQGTIYEQRIEYRIAGYSPQQKMFGEFFFPGMVLGWGLR